MRAVNLLAGLALATALAGCSDGDEGTAAEKPSPTAPGSPDSPAAAPSDDPKEALEVAYRDYVKAYLTGDGATSYALLSKRCQADSPLSEFAASSEAAADLYGLVDYEIKSITVNGDEGAVDAKYPVAALNQGGGSEWIREAGEWRMNGC